uniref:Uncharacterized protein n=1 Tax=Stegastes partitus TaxID=144197 RepID=A0A3B5B0K4_9TELE
MAHCPSEAAAATSSATHSGDDCCPTALTDTTQLDPRHRAEQGPLATARTRYKAGTTEQHVTDKGSLWHQWSNSAQLKATTTSPPMAQLERSPIKQLSFVKKPAPVPVNPDSVLFYGLRRSPGPMDDEDFFSLLLRVQGGRMDEQRTELPRLLQT